MAARPAWLLAGVVILCLGARGGLDVFDRWQAAHIVPSVPGAQVQRLARFDDGLALVGYDLPRPTGQPGKLVPLTFYLYVTQPQTQPVSVFVHLYGPGGQVLAQADQVDPLLFYPTTRWPLGQPQIDELSLALPADLPPGQYTLAMGLWNRATGERSHVLNAAGAPGDQDKLILTDGFTVTP
jgi:hypothetical protein